MRDKHIGRIKVTYAALEKALGIPAGHTIVRVSDDRENALNPELNTCQVIVEGPSLPLVIEGQVLPFVEATGLVAVEPVAPPAAPTPAPTPTVAPTPPAAKSIAPSKGTFNVKAANAAAAREDRRADEADAASRD